MAQGPTFGQILGGGQDYCLNKMTSHFPIVLEQKTIIFQRIGGDGCDVIVEMGFHLINTQIKAMFYLYFICMIFLLIERRRLR